MNPDPDPASDPTPFFSDFKDAKKNFSNNLPAGTLSSVFKKNFSCKHYFSPLNTFMRKGKDPHQYLWLIDPDPGGPKTCESGSGSPTLRSPVNLESLS
jgi:hypothetical protein